MRAFIQPIIEFVGMGWGRTRGDATRIKAELSRKLNQPRLTSLPAAPKRCEGGSILAVAFIVGAN